MTTRPRRLRRSSRATAGMASSCLAAKASGRSRSRAPKPWVGRPRAMDAGGREARVDVRSRALVAMSIRRMTYEQSSTVAGGEAARRRRPSPESAAPYEPGSYLGKRRTAYDVPSSIDWNYEIEPRLVGDEYCAPQDVVILPA